MPYDEPLSVAECPRCRERILRQKVGGIEAKANLTPVTDPVGDTGRVYRVTFDDAGRPRALRPAYPTELVAFVTGPVEARPYLVREHPCTAVSRPIPASGTDPAGGPGKAPQAGVQSLAGRTTPSPARSTDPSGARSAAQRRSDGPLRGPSGSSDGLAARPRCSACGKPCEDGTYASIALGDAVLWAEHVVHCTA